MSELRCEVMDLPKGQCAHCRQIDLPKPTEGLLVHRFLVARYDQPCYADNFHFIHSGEDIGQVVEEGDLNTIKGYVCAECVKEMTG